MTKPFMDEHFLLKSATAQKLYHEYAGHLPVVDYHCHLSPQEIYDNQPFANMTQLWLGGDHYKWRFMRSAGLREEYITGKQKDEAKFKKFCEVLPQGVGNPLYHWSHLELQRYFGIHELISSESSDAIWQACNARLQQPDALPRALIQRSNVKVVCTTDDPADDLFYHAALHKHGFETRVLPTFRPDVYLNIGQADYARHLTRLAMASSMCITSYDDLLRALDQRIGFFAAHGCVVSDHGLDDGVFFEAASDVDVRGIFDKKLNGQLLTDREIDQFRTAVLLHLGRRYAENGWAMQLHIGAQRSNNSKMRERIGPNTGFDSIADRPISHNLAALLDALDRDDLLPKTILYCLNPIHNEVLATMIGNFQDGSRAGKIQFGSGWWFNDQKDGMIRQMTALAHLGCLGAFVGMLTDSRSFISYPRHEYFRRILCNLIGEWVEEGEYPANWSMLRQVIEGICYHNAMHYFDFERKTG